MRRLFILALLLIGTELVVPLGEPGQGSRALLAFGFLILAAYTVGELATAIRLPKIVGYLFAGVIFGPSVLGTVTAMAADQLTPVSQLAIALIAFLAGAELRWAEVRRRGVLLLKIMTAELAITFAALFFVVWALAGAMPFLVGIPPAQRVAFSLLFASIAIVHSPAVTMALLTETGARGPVARTTLGVVLISDVAVLLLFTGALAVARALVPGDAGAPGVTIGMVAWEILGAILVGALLGGVVSLYLRFVGRELMLFAVLVAFFGLEIARVAHVETLLTLLVAGFVTENISPQGERLRHAMERSAAPVFVVFFALSGAKIDVGQVALLFLFVVPIAAVRAVAILAGTRVGARWARAGVPESRYTWMGLISQAGVAIGLAAIVAEAYPTLGPQLRDLLLALIAINETIGPILFRRALLASREAVEPTVARGDAPRPGLETMLRGG
jgi:Kef-type K+ transport system membrane component KefB